MLEAIRAWCERRQAAFPPPWYPQAFVLPDDLEAWRRHAAERPSRRWIYKPDGGARGIGIILVTGPEDVDTPESPFGSRCQALDHSRSDESPLGPRAFAKRGVIQEYVQDLQLLDRRKFAVRVYVLVARVRPLLVLLHSAAYVKAGGGPGGTRYGQFSTKMRRCKTSLNK